MSVKEPKFIKSPYFEYTENGWGLKEGAPEDVKKEFEEYMAYDEELKKRGISR